MKQQTEYLTNYTQDLRRGYENMGLRLLPDRRNDENALLLHKFCLKKLPILQKIIF